MFRQEREEAKTKDNFPKEGNPESKKPRKDASVVPTPVRSEHPPTTHGQEKLQHTGSDASLCDALAAMKLNEESDVWWTEEWTNQP